MCVVLFAADLNVMIFFYDVVNEFEKPFSES